MWKRSWGGLPERTRVRTGKQKQEDSQADTKYSGVERASTETVVHSVTAGICLSSVLSLLFLLRLLLNPQVRVSFPPVKVEGRIGFRLGLGSRGVG